MPRSASVVPSKIPSWLAWPEATARTSMPWAIRPFIGLCRADSSSVCSGLKSPESPAKASTAPSVTVRAA